MKQKMKKIIACVCAVVLTVTAIAADVSLNRANAAENEQRVTSDITPITLEGYKNVTLLNFTNSNGYLEDKIYGPADSENSYHYDTYDWQDADTADTTMRWNNILLSMKVDFASGTHKERLELMSTGQWSGITLYSGNAGNEIQLVDTYAKLKESGGLLCEVNKSEAEGVTSFLDEFLLQMSFEYEGSNLTIGIYINGALAKEVIVEDCTFTNMGSNINLYREGTTSAIGVKSVLLDNISKVTPAYVEGYKNVTVNHFKDASGNIMAEKTYGCVEGQVAEDNAFILYDAQGNQATNWNKTMLSMKVKFTGNNHMARLDIAGNSSNRGLALYAIEYGKKLWLVDMYGAKDASYSTLEISKNMAGVTSFMNNEFLLQVGFEYGDFDNDSTYNDVKIHLYINGNKCSADGFVLNDCDTTKLGSYLRLYREGQAASITASSVLPENRNLTEVQAYDFMKGSSRLRNETFTGDGSATSSYQLQKDGIANMGGTSFEARYNFEAAGAQDRIYFAGTNDWAGICFFADSDDKLNLWTGFSCSAGFGFKDNIFQFDPKIAGVGDTFLNKGFTMKVTTEFADYDGDGVANDVQLGFYFNGGTLYNNQYIYGYNCKNEFGNYLNILPQKGGITVSTSTQDPDESLEKITFAHFGLEDDVYKYNSGDFVFQGTYDDSLDGKVLCGDVLLTGNGTSYFMLGGAERDWTGLRFTLNKDTDSISCVWPANGNSTWIGDTTFESSYAGTSFVDTTFHWMVSMEMIDADGNGSKNDLKLGVWFNEILYKNQYITIKDCQNALGNQFAACCETEGDYIALRSVESIEPNPYYYTDISKYRGETFSAPEAPEGYIFSGWYEDATYKKPIDSSAKSGVAYAKFVKKDVLTVKGQVKVNDDGTVLSNNTSLRLITTADSLNYQEVAFEVAKEQADGTYGTTICSATDNPEGNRVYKKLYYIGDNSRIMTYEPTVFSPMSIYFKAWTLRNIPATDYGVHVKVTPYWITLDGTKVSGVTEEICVNDFNATQSGSNAVGISYLGGTDVMPIAGFFGPYANDVETDKRVCANYISDKYYKMISDMGINLIEYSATDYQHSPELVKKNLELGEKYGIGIFVNDGRVLELGSAATKEKVASFIEDYSSYKSFSGMYLVDEPRTDDFAYYGENKENVKDYSTLAGILQQDLNLLCFSNLYPYAIHSEWSSVNAENYSKYVNDACEALKPKVLSWDYYRYDSYGNNKDYFYNLDLMRKKANDSHIPFWAFVQAGSQWETTDAVDSTSYYPNEAQMKWNVNTNLAFGAQGIQYFSLIQLTDYAKAQSTTWDFQRNGFIGVWGNKNEWYDYAQNINKHIAAIDEVLMNSVNQGIMITGDDISGDLTQATNISKLSKYGKLDSVTTNDSFMIGCFNYKGKTALYVVNYSSIDPANITLNFAESCTVRKVQNAVTEESTGSSLGLSLTAGEGVLVVLE